VSSGFRTVSLPACAIIEPGATNIAAAITPAAATFKIAWLRIAKPPGSYCDWSISHFLPRWH
jgi:hypothetical protein